MPWNEAQLAGIRVEERPNGRRLRCFAERPTGGLWSMLEDSARERPEAEALVIGDERISYADFASTAERVAGNLRAQCGVEPGTRVGLLLGNCAEYAYAFFACQRLGAIAVPLNTRLQGPELETLLRHAGAAVLIGDSRYLDRLDAAHLPGLGHRFATGAAKQGCGAWVELARGGGPPPPTVTVDEDDPACILYTSGTTGMPKGAMLTHFNVAHSLIHYERAMGLARTPAERSLLAVPMSHVTGLVAQLLLMVYLGGCIVVLPEFKAGRFLEALRRERCTHTLVVPSIYALCLMEPSIDRLELPDWRVAGYGGAPMAQSTVAALAERFPGLRLHNVYGATETCSPTTINPAERALSHSASVGPALMCAELRVVDERGRDVPTGQPGELWIKGPMVVPGYWDDPEATRRSFVDGGYWRSGDVARVDEDGQVYILDRLKEMINRAGYKVYCAEVENVLYQHPDVLEAAVVGVSDPVLGERVKAALVPRAGHTLDPSAVRAFCAERLADYKVPELVEVRDALPRNAAGKAIKSLLREPAS
jgi:long-chain acyl-CoA synthetase